jgi:exopolyphosphatase/guanosine-5'-triphosphate,3'-diphosphate pyrophosphatase
VFLALTIYYRYEGSIDDARSNGLARLLDDDSLARALLIGEMLRLAYILSAAMPGMLPRVGLRLGPNKTLVLSFPRKLADLTGERVEKRLAALAAQMGRNPKIEIK